MQDPKKPSQARKAWYQKAMEVTTLWKTFAKPTEIPTTNPMLWRTLSKSSETSITTNNSHRQTLRKCTSLRVATSFTSVFLCAPISSYKEVFRADIPPRRSNSYPRTTKPLNIPPNIPQESFSCGRMSFEGRKIFRGKSLKDDVLMRRFVMEEEAMIMQVKRKNQMEVIRRRSAMRRRKLGPSPLSRMVLAEEE